MDHSIDITQAFWVGLFPKSISRSQEKAVELLGTLCRDVLVYCAWVDEIILSTSMPLSDIEAQGVYHFP